MNTSISKENNINKLSISSLQIPTLNANIQDNDKNCTSLLSSNTYEVQIPTIEQSLFDNSEQKLYLNRWEMIVDDFDDNEHIMNRTIHNCISNLRNELNYVNEYEFRFRTINPGFLLNEKDYINFICKLPKHIRDDYLQFKKDYCIINYGSIQNIMKHLNGIHDYQKSIKTKLPLYFKVENDIETNKLLLIDPEFLIDVQKSFTILQNKIAFPLHLVNKVLDHIPVYVHGMEGRIIMNLPRYTDTLIPQIIFILTHLLDNFVNPNKKCHNDTLVICPKNVLSYLHQYESQLKFIEDNCFLLSDEN